MQVSSFDESGHAPVHLPTPANELQITDRLLYRGSKLDCDVCLLKMRCCPKEPARKIPRSIHEDARDVARALAARDAVAATGPGMWLAIPPKFPDHYHMLKSSIPNYTVANLNGGVGKTTIALGLASHFANPFGEPGRKRERVLLIDLDFQGSLSSMAPTTADRIPKRGGSSRATRLISGECTGSELIQMHQRVKGLEPRDREDFGLFIKACQLARESAQAPRTKPRPRAAANAQRVAEAVEQLKQAYQDTGQFEPIFQRLSHDESLSSADLAAIATGFAYETPARTKKAESLRRIWLVHESYATSAAKSAFSGGKSAA